MPRLLCIFGILFFSVPGFAAEPAAWSVDGGHLKLSFSKNIAQNLGVQIQGREVRSGEILIETPIGGQGSLEFLAPGGHFEKLLGGSLPLAGPLDVSWPGGSLAGVVLRVAPAPGHPPALQLIDGQGASWLTFEYGHFDLSKDRLEIKIMDLRLGSGFAAALGNAGLNGQWLGGAELSSAVNRPTPELEPFAKGTCATPEWPTQPGASADLAMTNMSSVSEVLRSGGRVAIAPSAYFRNVGSADLPWFGMFATPVSDSTYCEDSGDGTCEPYATDQGGYLVYALYRFLNGRLEQLGRSAAKHAFNSVNLTCSCPSGRIVWQGCEDNYPTNNNSDRDFLGPRSEITAHLGTWQRAGSIFDANGDGVCDHPNVPFLGSVRCMAPAATPLDRLLHVAATDLTTLGSRYFMETWYVVRDDINIFNSMGRNEISPTFSSNMWQFPTAGFQQGPVVDQFFPIGGGLGFTSGRFSSTTGRYQVISRAVALGGGRYRYDLMVMNFDFDRQFRKLTVPLPTGAQAGAFEFIDGDDDPGNDWTVALTTGALAWRAPPGNGLDWGSLYTFSFEASLPPAPVNGTVELQPLESGTPSIFTATALKLLDDVIHADGFEG